MIKNLKFIIAVFSIATFCLTSIIPTWAEPLLNKEELTIINRLDLKQVKREDLDKDQADRFNKFYTDAFLSGLYHGIAHALLYTYNKHETDKPIPANCLVANTLVASIFLDSAQKGKIDGYIDLILYHEAYRLLDDHRNENPGMGDVESSHQTYMNEYMCYAQGIPNIKPTLDLYGIKKTNDECNLSGNMLGDFWKKILARIGSNKNHAYQGKFTVHLTPTFNKDLDKVHKQILSMMHIEDVLNSFNDTLSLPKDINICFEECGSALMPYWDDKREEVIFCYEHVAQIFLISFYIAKKRWETVENFFGS